MAHKVEKDASENNKMHDCAMCNFFRKSESSKYRYKRFGYPDPYPVPIWKQFLYIRIRLQTHYPTG